MKHNTLKEGVRVVCLVIIVSILGLDIANSNQFLPNVRERFKTPPSEFNTVCEGRKAGDTVTIKANDGVLMKAVCEMAGDRMVAISKNFRISK